MKSKKRMIALLCIGVAIPLSLAVLPVQFPGKEIVITVLTGLFVLGMVAAEMVNVLQKQQRSFSLQEYTRTVNPKLGWLGCLGLLGLLGFLTVFQDSNLGMPFPFIFFSFFGFFGFYYEGKMSHTLIDERFRMNAFKAEALATKVALMMIVLVTILCISVLRVKSPYLMTGILFSTIGIAFGLSIFLGQYLLYRYDEEE